MRYILSYLFTQSDGPCPNIKNLRAKGSISVLFAPVFFIRRGTGIEGEYII